MDSMVIVMIVLVYPIKNKIPKILFDIEFKINIISNMSLIRDKIEQS